MKLSLIMIVLLSLLMVFCSSPQTKAETDENGAKNQVLRQAGKKQDQIPAAHCRISGTVVAIDEQLASKSNTDPCSKAPCMATISVDSVYGFGPGFSGSVSVGMTIEVTFPFTLGSTELLDIKTEKHLPGLEKDDRFMADMESRQVFGGATSYIIFTYDKL